MLDTIFNLIGLTSDSLNLNDDVVFIVLSMFLLYCIGYVFNFFQCLMERMTAKRGR